MTTKLQWVSHASCLITHNDYFLLTDPWYCKKAFTSWTVKPPPYINLNFLIDLSKSGKLGILISHHHFDHFDISFIKKLDQNTPIFITDFKENKEENLPCVKALYNCLVDLCSMKKVIEIMPDGHFDFFGPFKIMSLRRPAPYVIDGILLIETDDCFIIHGADCWGINESSYAGKILKQNKPKNKVSIIMGQAGTASGYPLIYDSFTEEEKIDILNKKTHKMIKNLYETSKTFGIDKILPYAHLSYVYFNDIDFFTKYNYKPISGYEANKLINCDKFLEIHPSSIVIPNNNFQIINLIPSLNLLDCFGDNMMPEQIINFEINNTHFKKLDDWINGLKFFINSELEQNKIIEEDIDLKFKIIIHRNKDENNILYENEINFINGTRNKTLKCSETIIVNIINGNIPFKDLLIGYLCKIYRNPPEYYNDMFLMLLNQHSHKFFNCNIIDSEEYEFQE